MNIPVSLSVAKKALYSPQPEGVRMDSVSLSRGGRLLVRDVRLDVNPGETVLVRGPNGAGKTSLLRALAGWIKPCTGHIIRPDSLVYVGHHHALKNSETPRQSLAFWALWKDVPSETVDRALDIWGLAALAGRPAGRLSAGQRQRAVLARLDLRRTPLWLLDEPTTALDAQGEAVLASRLAEHRQRGGIVLAATHVSLDWPDVRVLQIDSTRITPRPTRTETDR